MNSPFKPHQILLTLIIVFYGAGCATDWSDPNDPLVYSWWSDEEKSGPYKRYRSELPADIKKEWAKRDGKISKFPAKMIDDRELTELALLHSDLRQWLSGPAWLQIEEAMVKKGLDPSELEIIQERELEIGMSIYAMFAVLGRPLDNTKTVTAYGVSWSFVYGEPHIIGYYGSVTWKKRLYVFAENLEVTSWSE